MKKTLLFYIFATLCFLPVILLRDYTPANELRYLSIADEALRQGHLFAFTNHGAVYADKPPLFLWLVMLVRLTPSFLQHLLLGMLTVLPAYVTIEVTADTMHFEGRERTLMRLLTLTTGLFLVSMLTLRMDMLMCMFIMLAVRQFYRCYNSGRPHESFLLPLYIFLGVFTKGPYGAMIPLAVIIAFLVVKGRLSDFFRVLGWRSWTLLIALFGLWFGAVYAEGGTAYLSDLVFHQTVGRAYHSFHHREPVYYYLYMMWPLLLPWTFAMVYAAWNSLRKKSVDSESQRLMTIGCMTTFVILSIVSAKLSIYFLPFVPFAAALTTKMITQKMPSWTLAIGYVPFALTFPAFLTVQGHLEVLKPHTAAPVIAALTIISMGAITALVTLRQHDSYHSVVAMAGGLLVGASIAGFAMPKINKYIGFHELCQEALEIGHETHASQYVAVGIRHHENMCVFLGTEPVGLDSTVTPRPLPARSGDGKKGRARIAKTTAYETCWQLHSRVLGESFSLKPRDLQIFFVSLPL